MSDQLREMQVDNQKTKTSSINDISENFGVSNEKPHHHNGKEFVSITQCLLQTPGEDTTEQQASEYLSNLMEAETLNQS